MQANLVEVQSNKSEHKREYYGIFYLLKSRNPPLIIDLKVNSCKVRMEVDTGASASIIKMEMYQEFRCKLNKLMLVNSQFRIYSGNVIKPMVKLNRELV